nr:carboxylesterase family protein [Acetobacter sacchari]
MLSHGTARSTSPAREAVHFSHDVKISTALGEIAGTERDGVEAFKGIPFAQPPIGALRWAAPQPASRWAGVLDATHFRSDCMQKPFPSDAAPLGGPVSEDCLYLNIWRPVSAVKTQSPGLPVMVWIYGGGFVNGGSSPAVYSGAPIAKQGVVVVSFNYRLGRFGTFDTGSFRSGGMKSEKSANYGFEDQLAALRWVKGHIAEFGGDPQRVTVVGESAGGVSVHMLLTSPNAGDLFSQAVIQSGAEGVMRGATSDAARSEAKAFAQAQGILPDDPNALAKLKALPASAILGDLNMMALFYPPAGPKTFSSPFPDGELIAPALDVYKTGAFRHIPMMIGATSADLGGQKGFMIAGAERVASLLSRENVPVYKYKFSYVSSSSEAAGVHGAAHATDIPFFMGTAETRYGTATSQRDRKAAAEANIRLVNFIKTGNPSADGADEWPRYTSSAPCVLDFTTDGSRHVSCR